MLRARPETGGTHRSRVHLAAIGRPLYADQPYGKLVAGERLWLRAEYLAFTRPVSSEDLGFEAGIPEDLRASAALGFEA